MAKPPTHLPCGTAHWTTEKCPAAKGERASASVPSKLPAALTRTEAQARDKLAGWMSDHGFPPGKADTIDALLLELETQISALLGRIAAFETAREKERAATAERVRKSRKKKGKP